MPEIFRFFGFSFFFYSKEHDPIHVHVEGKDGFAKFQYDGERFNLRESHGIKAGDMKKIQFVIDDNADIIVLDGTSILTDKQRRTHYDNQEDLV